MWIRIQTTRLYQTKIAEWSGRGVAVRGEHWKTDEGGERVMRTGICFGIFFLLTANCNFGSNQRLQSDERIDDRSI